MNAETFDGTIVLAVLTTLSTMIMIGLGFLYRPSTATLLWSMLFVLFTLSSMSLLASQAVGSHRVEDAAVGLTMGAPALAWSGLRASRGAKAVSWVGPLISIAAALAMMVSEESYDPFIYAGMYLVGSTWAALSVRELLRRPEHGTGRLLPLTLVSGVLPILAVVGAVAAVLEMTDRDLVNVLPDLKAIGVVAYVTCALVTLLSLARDPGPSSIIESDAFPTTAADRLARAADRGEDNWSLIMISLDDVDALRTAGGEDTFRQIVDQLKGHVRSTFPADADIGLDGSAAILVLVCRPDAAVRDCMNALLDRLAVDETEQPLSVGWSASLGWSRTRSVGYAVAALTAAATAAMSEARSEGGARWRRDGG